jgi:hypothetical protein
MSQDNVYNGPLPTLGLSGETLPDGNRGQRVVAVQADDTPVAGTAAQSRFTVSTTTVSISTKLPGLGETYAILEAQVADLYYWLDGKDPATTPGHILYAGYSIRLSGAALTNCKLLRATTTDGIAVISYFKKPAT